MRLRPYFLYSRGRAKLRLGDVEDVVQMGTGSRRREVDGEGAPGHAGTSTGAPEEGKVGSASSCVPV